MTTRDLFISHASTEADVARELRVDLEAAGYTCWMAPDDIVGTETWTEQILAAIDGCRAMVVLVSGAANRSAHVSREVNLALGRRRAVLPVRIEDVPPQGSLEYLLSLVQRVDAFPPPISAHRERVLRRVESTLRVADAAASPPEPAPAPGPEPAPAPPDTVLPAPGPPGPLGPGSVVAGFTIESILGEGGMATVYRARQAEPNRAVALKVIRADHASNPTYRQRFLGEKDTLAALEHPGIVPIYAAGESGGRLYIAMRLVPGRDLQARIAERGPLSLDEVVAILRPIADAVDHAHAEGVIHRDLKPSNILLDAAGRPYLTDFGLGKRMSGGADLSDPGIAIGTLGYMAPEQLDRTASGALTPAVDVYALACVAFACLTGRSAFPQPSAEQVLAAKLAGPPPSARAANPALHEAVDLVLAQGLARDPAARYASAAGFVRELAEVGAIRRGDETMPVSRPTDRTPVERLVAWARANTAVAVIGASLTLVTGVIVAVNLVPDPPDPTPGPTATLAPTASPATPTPTPTPAPPTPTPDAAAFPNAAERTLLATLPAGYGNADVCARYEDPYPGSLAMVRCPGSVDDARPTFYALFPNLASLNETYASIVLDGAGVAVGGLCRDAIPANRPWNYGEGTPHEGDLACYARANDQGSPIGVQYVWTHRRTLTLASWLAPSNTAGLDFWTAWANAVRP